NLILQAGAVTESPAFPVLFTFAVLLFFEPLRTRLQALVDRVFFRTRYDGAQVLASVGAELAATLQRGRILALVRECVGTALANQAAIALENARTYEALIELNARLEQRVRERTAQLEGANRELADAYAELKNAEVQLVQSEKMASLGRLVAGVAHEINNPVSFISSSVAPLRRRLETAAADAPPEVAELLADAREIVAVMARGAERTAAIVKDLRSFSRLGEAARKPVDLHDGLEVSLRLLEPRWRGRIEI